MIRRTGTSSTILAAAAILAALLPGCTDSRGAAGAPAQNEPHSPAPTNRIDIPAPVRRNLGVTFARVERRAVASTLRLPGRFELLPDATREYRAMLPGQVEPAVAQFQAVQPGDLLYRLRSPRWREMQREIADAEAAIRAAAAASATIGPLRDAHHAHERSLEESVRIWTDRIEQLERLREAAGGKADELAAARAELATARAGLAEVLEKDAELEAREREIAAQLDVGRSRLALLLATASAITGLPADSLASTDDNGEPRWRTIDVIEVRADAPGVVASIPVAGGAWADESGLVLTTVRPDRLRFHARALQSDLARLRDGLPARIAPPGGAADLQDDMPATLAVGIGGDPEARTIDLYATPESLRPWARPGVAAYLEVTLEGGREELAIPRGAVTRDGLTPVIFRRDPRDPDKVIRLQADLGVDDGRWVVVRSGVREGDEVVVGGAYQLMLASSGSAPKGGHFHADGTYHEGEH